MLKVQLTNASFNGFVESTVLSLTSIGLSFLFLSSTKIFFFDGSLAESGSLNWSLTSSLSTEPCCRVSDPPTDLKLEVDGLDCLSLLVTGNGVEVAWRFSSSAFSNDDIFAGNVARFLPAAEENPADKELDASFITKSPEKSSHFIPVINSSVTILGSGWFALQILIKGWKFHWISRSGCVHYTIENILILVHGVFNVAQGKLFRTPSSQLIEQLKTCPRIEKQGESSFFKAISCVLLGILKVQE